MTHVVFFFADRESYWGSYLKYRKRCLYALWRLELLGAAATCVAMCALEHGCWCQMFMVLCRCNPTSMDLVFIPQLCDN